MRKISEYFTIERRLVFSVVIGWAFVIFGFIIPYILYPKYPDYMTYGFLFTTIYLCVRYSTFGPIFGAAGRGLTVVAGVSIIDYIFSRRNEVGSLTLGALIGTLIVVFFVVLWNTVKALYYLIRETITLIRNFDYIKQSLKHGSIA